jgi:hypothetical protein
MADKLIEGPVTSGDLMKKPSLTPTGSHTTNGEGGYKKRTGGRFPETTKDLGDRLKNPTKR